MAKIDPKRLAHIEGLLTDTLEAVASDYLQRAKEGALAPSELSALVKLLKDNAITVQVTTPGREIPEWITAPPADDDFAEDTPMGGPGGPLPFLRGAGPSAKVASA